MQTFNIVMALVFAAGWIYTLVKGGTDFIHEPVWKKLTIAGIVTAYMLTWILINVWHAGDL